MTMSSHGLRVTAALLVLAAVSMGGCAKKTAVPDVTQQTPGGGKGPGAGDSSAVRTPEAGQDDASRKGSQGAGDLKDVFFDYDQHVLTADARSVLSGDASVLREMAALRVTIEGHCDERGTVEYNLALGQRRADAARNYLVDLGIDAGRLATISYGEERPFASGHDESAWSQNRRAHFRVNNP